MHISEEYVREDRLHMLDGLPPELANLQDSVWKNLLKASNIIRTSPKKARFSDCAACNGFRILLRGNARVYQAADDGREITLYHLSPGEFCFLSLTSLESNRDYNIHIEVKEDVYTLNIPTADYELLMQKSNVFRETVLSYASKRIFSLVTLVNDTKFTGLKDKLVSVLLEKFSRSEDSDITITHQQLAFELGVTRESVNRVLLDMEAGNCVALSRGRIKLVEKLALQSFK